MLQLLIGGTLLLAAWVAWTLYIANNNRPVKVSLVLWVDKGEEYLDPFLRSVCQMFRQTHHVMLSEVWVLDSGDGPEARQIINRLQLRYPMFRFRSYISPGHASTVKADGDILWLLDLANRLTPLRALDALAQLLNNGPMPPGSTVLLPNS